ncbi:MAG: ferric iron uptake transcriptional regulator [Cellvibrionales bacterium]|nr:MAG: ferric iron uptake transcriptional regulator [Cellvibrionales bacterium]
MSQGNKELKKAGLKVTHPRIKILQIMESEKQRHLSADDVFRCLHEKGDDVGIATVYRVLTQFETAGLIQRHSFDTGPALYELNRGDHHDHMICVDSGEVSEFHNEEIEALQRRIAEEQGYELIGHSLVLYVKPKE